MLLVAKIDKDVLTEVYRLISEDIHYLKHVNNIPDYRIKISIPNFILKMMEYYSKSDLFYRDIRFTDCFGCEIVPGYNNQICVFDVEADFKNEFTQPIEFTITNDKWIQINRL